MAVIGILNAPLVVSEDVGSVRVYVGFREPDNISDNINISITFFTTDGSATGNHTLEMHNLTQYILSFFQSWIRHGLR